MIFINVLFPVFNNTTFILLTGMNQRRSETSSLRNFFQDQLETLGRLVQNFQYQKSRQQQDRANLHEAIETLVNGTDTRIRGIGSYQKQLRDSASKLLQHINSLVDHMPPAIAVNKTTLITDPLVSTFFENREVMQDLFSGNKDVQSFFKAQENSETAEVFALLFITRKEKHILGAEVHNGIIIKDVAQTHVSFYDHRLVAPTRNEEEARLAMKKTLFECVVTHLKKHITDLRHNLSEAEQKHVAQHPEQNLSNPEVYIKMLAQQLSLPTELIKLHDQVIRLNKMGIKLSMEQADPAEVLQMKTLEVGENCCQAVCIVHFPRDELLPPTSGLFSH